MTALLLVSIFISGCHSEPTTFEENDALGGYPHKAITWISPVPEGAFLDLFAKAAAQQLALDVVIENIPGQTQTIGTREAWSKPADGYTILTVGNGASNIKPLMEKDLGYRIDDFVPIALLALHQAQVLCVRSDSEIESVEDWIEAVKADQTLRWTASNPGSVGHISAAMTLLQLGAGNDVFLSSTGTSDVVQSLLYGDVDFAVFEARNAIESSERGEVRMLALLNAESYKYAPHIPPISEYGVEGIDNYTSWVWVGIHKDTPVAIIDYLREAFKEVVYSEDYQRFLADMKFNTFDREYSYDEILQWREEVVVHYREALIELDMISE